MAQKETTIPEGNSQLLAGSIFSALLRFAVPIILSNIFQQLYYIIDALIIGRYLGDLPLSGISIASPVMDILYAVLIGGSIGIGVLIGNLYGARDWEKLKVMHTTALGGGCVITLALAAMSYLICRPILILQGNSEASVEEAMKYLLIILTGLIFTYLYNYYASLLRAFGNSGTPFMVLLVSSVLHAGLDLLLVGVCSFGIRGVAFSTVICQAFSAAWLHLYTYHHDRGLFPVRGEKLYSSKAGKVLLGFAWAAALQQAVVCIGRFLVQGTLTDISQLAVTGYNMAMRNEQFLFCFSQGISAAMAVCISQNYGSGDYKRIRDFFHAALKVQLVLSTFLGTVCFLLSDNIICLFSQSEEAVSVGSQYIRVMAYIYIVAFLAETAQAFFRGLGRLKLTMMVSASQVFLRVVLSFILMPRIGILGICFSISFAWILILVFEGGYGLKVAKRLGAGVVQASQTLV